VTPTALLADLDAAGVHLTRAGDDLRYRTRPGVSIAPFREQIAANKPALLALLALQGQIVEAASAARERFDRDTYDRLWREWYDLERQP
jgi:hypothetical protein